MQAFLTNRPLRLTSFMIVALPLIGFAGEPQHGRHDDKRPNAADKQAMQAQLAAKAAKEAADRAAAAAREAAQKEAQQARAAKEAAEKRAKDAQRAAMQALKLEQLKALKDAHILLAMGNHDYDGCRHRAMNSVGVAINIIDENFLQKGSNGERVVAFQSEIDAARARFIEQHKATIHENQRASDLQLKAARVILLEIHASAAKHKQKRIETEVRKAIDEIDAALRHA
jgi:hypothetical protein